MCVTAHFLKCIRSIRSFGIAKHNIVIKRHRQIYTGPFIMFSVITNFYNKKTNGPTLMELFTATGKLKKFFLTTRELRCVHHGWHSTYPCDIQVLATHASTWVHRYSSLLQWSVPKGSEEYRCTQVDECVARTWISHRCVSCHPWCTHRTSLVVKKRFKFSCGCEQFHWGRSFGFLVINVCNHGEHCETPRLNHILIYNRFYQSILFSSFI
jgi:hypothetical protein